MSVIKVFLMASVFFIFGFTYPLKKSSEVVTDKSWGVATYRLTYHPDSTTNNTRIEEYKLLLGKTSSRFQSQASRSRDSLTNLIGSLPPTQETIDFYTKKIYSLPLARFRYIIYKKNDTKQITYYDWLGASFYQYEETGDLFHWIIAPSITMIGGYKCQKATTAFAGRKFEAWFTREIPVSYGPYKFYGLPGLIIKVGDIHGQYLFELVRLTKNPTPIDIELPTKKAKITTKALFRPAQTAYYLSLADRMANVGNITNVEAHQRSKRLNPLELH